MSDGAFEDAKLARLAELDLAAVEKAHASLMAAEDADEIAQLGRTYQGLSRALRQTVALKARLAREAALDERRAELSRPREFTPYVDPDQEALDQRVDDLRAAGKRLLFSYFGRDSHRIERMERFEAERQDWIDEEDFLDVDLDTQLVRLCHILGLPEHWAPNGREPAPEPDEAEPDEPHNTLADPPSLHRESG